MALLLSKTMVLSAGLAAASAVVVLLGIRYGDLTEDYRRLRVGATTLHAGYAVPTFQATTLAGDTITVGETSDSSTRQRLFLLTTTCPFCRQTLPVWHNLADSVRKLSGWRIETYAISLDSRQATEAFARDYGLPSAIVNFPREKLHALYRASRVPQTVVLDHEGHVLFAKTGLLTPSTVIDSIYRALTWQPNVRDSAPIAPDSTLPAVP